MIILLVVHHLSLWAPHPQYSIYTNRQTNQAIDAFNLLKLYKM